MEEPVKQEQGESKKAIIGMYKKIEDILNNDRLIKIYGLLPNKESKQQFLERVLSVYEDRLSEKFEQRLEDEFEPNTMEMQQNQKRGNIRSIRSIQGVLRGRRSEPINQGVTERINYLNTQLQQGNYISKEDIEFLAFHLADRPNGAGISPSSRRDEIRTTIDTYIRARNMENSNKSVSYLGKQLLARDIQRLQSQLKNLILHQYDPIKLEEANSTYYGEDINEDPYTRVTKRRQQEIQNLRTQIAQLAELQSIDVNNNSLNSMLHTPNEELNLDANTLALEDLMAILEEEITRLSKKGVKLPKKGIKSTDEVELPIETESEESETIKPIDALRAATASGRTTDEVDMAKTATDNVRTNEGETIHEQQ